MLRDSCSGLYRIALVPDAGCAPYFAFLVAVMALLSIASFCSSNAWIATSLEYAGVGLIDAAETIAALARISGIVRSIGVLLVRLRFV
jgi:hypothetical protein